MEAEEGVVAFPLRFLSQERALLNFAKLWT
jgi:hypothetical protein